MWGWESRGFCEYHQLMNDLHRLRRRFCSSSRLLGRRWVFGPWLALISWGTPGGSVLGARAELGPADPPAPVNSRHHHGTAHGASQTAAALDTVPEWIRAFPAERPQDRGVLYQHQARYGEAVARQVALHLAAIGGSRAVRNLGPRELLLQWPRAEHNHGGGVDHIFVDPGAGWRRSQLKLVPGAGSGGDSAMEWQVITEGFDGETVWRQAGMSPARALEGVERDGVLLEAALRSMRYLDPGWPLVRIEEAAPETLAAGIHDALDLVAPAGTRARLFFDRAERVVRAVQYIASGPTGAPPPGMPRWVEWEDYRFHRGVACPFRFDV